MTHSTLLIALLVGAIGLLVPLVVRPSFTVPRAGRVFAFVAIVVVPVMIAALGMEEHVERSKTVAFCTSCHVMKQYGTSLHVDDIEHLAAAHYQFGRVPRETACFSCHTHYTMYGDLTAKLRGLRHVWVQYLGTVPDKVKLYEPFHNRECLHCHDGARSFEEAVTHKSEPGRLALIRGNQLSCLSSGCHATVHTVDKLNALALWPSGGDKP